MILLGVERYVTNPFQDHKTAEDYSGAHLSPVKITGKAKVVRVVNRYQVYEDAINYDDFIKNQNSWKKGEEYYCISITGKQVRFPKGDLGGNCVELEGYIGNELYHYGVFHLASTNVQVGDIVDSNTILGYQGNTGLVNSSKSRADTTYGTHVHFEVKKGNITFVNPRNYALGQEVISYVEQSNSLDQSQDQIHIVADKINIRSDPTVDSMDLGDVYQDEIYTILEEKEDILYTWYHIKTNLGVSGWVASSKEEHWLDVWKAIPKETQPEEDNHQPPEEIPDPPKEEYILLFTCPKTDTYYLTLQEGEKLYLGKEDHY